MIRAHWRSTSTSLLLCLAGLGIVVAMLAADHFWGATELFVGGRRRFRYFIAAGTATGVALLMAGVLLSPAWRSVNSTALRWAAALGILTWFLLMALAGTALSPTWFLLAYVAAICVLLPLRFGIPTLAGVLAVQWLASWINAVKVDLTGLPLTMLDIKIAVGNSAGLWEALSLPHWTRHVAIGGVAIVLAWWAYAAGAAALSVLSRALRRRLGHDAFARLAAVVLLGTLTFAFIENLFAEIRAFPDAWDPEYVAKLVKRVGVLPFVAYAYRIESTGTGDIYRKDIEAEPLSREEMRDAASRYVAFEDASKAPRDGLLPNLVVVLAESTFDPGRTFRLQGEWNSELFTPGSRTAALGPLKVNAVGGGTWITEFETIVGLDSRLFGYSGYYTHASVAPFIERSIATYLHERGYSNWAFFPHEGKFYNGRRAYVSYGFDVVRDSADLAGKPGGWLRTDPEIAASVEALLGTEPEAPFFAYVILLQNHGPHKCNVPDAGSFKARFTDVDDFGPNCALHEYLRRLDSTTTAVRSLEAYLSALEARTGRPFVMLVFGDHLPHTFTSTGGFHYDYAPMLRIDNLRTTFFHFLSSRPGRLNCCEVAPPATLLPTLLSSFVAKGPDDLFLGENLWLFSHCGSDAVRRHFGPGVYGVTLGAAKTPDDACTAAYWRTVATYRAGGTVRLR